MLFSIYFRIDHREEFLNKYIQKYFKDEFSVNDKEIIISRFTDLMELMVNMILNNDKNGLYNILTKKNTKSGRIFFNYLTCSNLRSINKEVITNRLNELFKEGTKI